MEGVDTADEVEAPATTSSGALKALLALPLIIARWEREGTYLGIESQRDSLLASLPELSRKAAEAIFLLVPVFLAAFESPAATMDLRNSSPSVKSLLSPLLDLLLDEN